MKCKECKYNDHEKFENTTMSGCKIILYLIKKHHNKYYTDALIGQENECKIYKYLKEYFKEHNSIKNDD